MKFEDISSFSREECVQLIDLCGLADDYSDSELSSKELDDLHAILFSFGLSVGSHFLETLEVARLFHQPVDLVRMLLESTQWRLTTTTLHELHDLSPEEDVVSTASLIHVDSTTGLVVCWPDVWTVGQPVVLVHDPSPAATLTTASTPIAHSPLSDQRPSLSLSLGDERGTHVVLCPPISGVYEATVYRQYTGAPNLAGTEIETETDSRSVLVSSVAYQYTESLTSAMDQLLWGWNGHFSEDMEQALVQLVVFTDEELATWIHRWAPMLTAMSSSSSTSSSAAAGDELQSLLSTITDDLHQALQEHSAYAIGRLQQSFDQLLEMGEGPMQGLFAFPPSFYEWIRRYVTAKVQASSLDELWTRIHVLVSEWRPIGSIHASSSSLVNM
jgi:hypothetical protein